MQSDGGLDRTHGEIRDILFPLFSRWGIGLLLHLDWSLHSGWPDPPFCRQQIMGLLVLFLSRILTNIVLHNERAEKIVTKTH